jgi:hypothetical protein
MMLVRAAGPGCEWARQQHGSSSRIPHHTADFRMISMDGVRTK